jgi:hypothetical protein
MDAVLDFVRDFTAGAFGLAWRMLLVVVPIIVLIEVVERTRPFRVFVRAWARLVGRWLGMSEKAAAPTVVGFLFGLAYGGSLIVRDTHRHSLRRRQVFQMSVFLSMVHAVIEDSLIFIALGASAVWIVGFRMIWAVLVTIVLGAVAAALVRRFRRPVPSRRDDDG